MTKWERPGTLKRMKKAKYLQLRKIRREDMKKGCPLVDARCNLKISGKGKIKFLNWKKKVDEMMMR